MASLYLRGQIWWMKRIVDGSTIRRSTGKKDWNEAREVLQATTTQELRVRYRVRPLPESGFSGVYFVLMNGLVKIGYATKLRHRVMQILWLLKPGEPVFLGWVPSLNPRELEHELHERFWELRRTGEWFEDAPELRAAINTFNEQHQKLLDAYIASELERARPALAIYGSGRS